MSLPADAHAALLDAAYWSGQPRWLMLMMQRAPGDRRMCLNTNSGLSLFMGLTHSHFSTACYESQVFFEHEHDLQTRMCGCKRLRGLNGLRTQERPIWPLKPQPSTKPEKVGHGSCQSIPALLHSSHDVLKAALKAFEITSSSRR